MSKMMYNWSPKQTFDKIQYNAYGIRVITKIKILGNVSNYTSSLRNVYNYQFRSLSNIGNTPPMNKKSIGTKTFSIIIQNS
jgi:hypothetical protein